MTHIITNHTIITRYFDEKDRLREIRTARRSDDGKRLEAYLRKERRERSTAAAYG